ncbi:baculoviral IAP repeat-containing protein 1 [Sorex fumeus]|uniref:baculoviral IAP repeat-containing protein 1 n=1 Tax=Sorex fumeus TaxID=62283 RepID=UPI0024AD1495|nr:baculoviral IAP repeat-containing protein 1 [Sorex fumeus]
MASPEQSIFQVDDTTIQHVSDLLGRDMTEFVKEMVAEEEKARAKMRKGFNAQMRSEARRLKTFETYTSCSNWVPQELAAVGFYYIKAEHSAVQCFCCSLILFHSSFWRSPLEDHQKLHPDCAFLLGRDVGNIAKYDVRVQRLEQPQGGERAGYREERARLASFQDWPFYVQGVSPRDLSAAGFVFTGRRDTVCCFSCGGCLGNWEEGDDPWKEHAKWFPRCEFLRSMKSSEEIVQYIQSYKGFVGVTGAHFVNSWVRRDLPMASAYCNNSIFANEELRQDTFKEWSQVSPEAAMALARAGLFYTGIDDTVQCFSCGGCFLGKAGADPLKDHANSFPSCQFLQNMKSSAEMIPDIQSSAELPGFMESTRESPWEDLVAPSAVLPETVQSEAQWFQEAKRLSEQLREAYIKASFRRLSLLDVSPGVPTDLLLGCDLSLASKQIGSPGQEPVVLSEVLANLNSVMCVEGEAGSGKTVFLKKIALLWASGCCPLLSRFQLVFYLSLGTARLEQGLASMLGDQLLEAGASVSEACLAHIIQQLKNQVLFLLDDYKETSAVPHAIEKLIQKNHLSRSCVLIAARTHRAKDLRRYLDTTLEIGVFPFYHTIFILKRVFSDHLPYVEKFSLFFFMNKTLQEMNKTPLFVEGICTHWFQYPLDECFEVMTFKSYMEGLFRKHKDTAALKTVVSACGELALRGFFASCFKFSDEDLLEAGLGDNDELVMGLMSKFTAQRLKPVYHFLTPALQEFLAGMQLVALLGSERQEEQELGLYYLKQMNSSMMTLEAYNNFLKYVCYHCSSKAGPIIVSHLLHLLDNQELCETLAENDEYLKHHPEMSENLQLIRMLWWLSPQYYFSIVSKHILTLAIKVAYQSGTVATCSPFLLQFLQGRTLPLDLLQLQYFSDHPESLSLLKSVEVFLQGKGSFRKPDLSKLKTCFDKSQAPSIEQDCVPAFVTVEEWEQNVAENEADIQKYMNSKRVTPPAVCSGYWQLSPKPHKIPLLEVRVRDMGAVDAEMLSALMTIFSACQHIELHLAHSGGFIESIRPALEQYQALFTKCTIEKFELSTVEWELLLSLHSLESLEVSEITQGHEKLFTNLDKFQCLKELSVYLGDKEDVFAVIPENFLNLNHMEKLLIKTSAEHSTSKLVKLIENSPNLHVFHLQCNLFLSFESLMSALASCKKLEEINFYGPFFNTVQFVTTLQNFASLKILNIRHQEFPDMETSEIFAHALGSLSDLEELFLPAGEGIHRVAKLIIQQCQHLQYLRVFSFSRSLNDDSLMEIAKVAINGGFQKLENLDLSMNDKITEEGYRNFFQALDNLPNLRELNISRHFITCIRAQATTVKSLSQCISRLQSLTSLAMGSWLLDAEDTALLNAMKERHPQMKYLTLHQKWVLPFSPIIKE